MPWKSEANIIHSDASHASLLHQMSVIFDSYGLSAGAYGHDPAKQSLNNIFASNHLERNGDTPGAPQIRPHHGPDGANSGDFWISNTVVGGFPYDSSLPTDNAAVTIFDP